MVTEFQNTSLMQIHDEFADAFARAWFKLTHRDMGPKSMLFRQLKFQKKN